MNSEAKRFVYDVKNNQYRSKVCIKRPTALPGGSCFKVNVITLKLSFLVIN